MSNYEHVNKMSINESKVKVSLNVVVLKATEIFEQFVY